MPMTMSPPEIIMPLVGATCLRVDHCWTTKAVAASVWAKAMDMPNLPKRRRTKPGAQPCNSVNPDTMINPRLATLQGRYRDAIQAVGIFRKRTAKGCRGTQHTLFQGRQVQV